ncbi:MAG: methionyl-tRNA formyltransferase [Alphaproteobacteria bacterium]|nr:methionyl-tRNA formyltransferase [Alphaproteobacteria bacterium]
MGAPPFAATILGALISGGHNILAVYTQPPRPAGRGYRLQPSAVQTLAQRHHLELRCPASLRSDEVQQEFAAFTAVAAVVAAYGLILPRKMLCAPRLGCLNVHASLLPRWRGAAPIQRALLAGDTETGITVMQMEEGLDTGPILMQRALSIGPEETAAGLTEALARLGGELILEALDKLNQGHLTPRPQPREGVTYAAKIERAEGRLNWRRPAAELERRVRALASWPGAFFEYRGEEIRVLGAGALPGSGDEPPGTVLNDRLSIACGSGVLQPSRLQRPGRSPLDTGDFLRGYPIAAGTLLPCPATS